MVLFSFCFSPQVFADDNPCDPDYDPCPSEVWYTYGTVFYHPSFPTCMIGAEVYYKYCPTTGKYYYRVTNIDYPNGGAAYNSDCVALLAWLAADASRISQLYELAMDIQAKALFTNFMADYPNDPRIPCPGGQVSYIASVAKCNAFCYYEDTQNAKMVAIPRICTDGCCVIEHKLCWDATTQSIVETRTVSSQGSTSACSGSTSTCPSSIVRKNSNGIGTHTVLLDSVTDCITSSDCE